MHLGGGFAAAPTLKNSIPMKIALLGATGLVGRTMLQVLEQHGFGDCEIIPAASPRSIGKTLPFAGRTLTVVSPDDAIALRPEYAIFSAGASASRHYAPLFAQAGCTVVDNSSCWRMDPDVPLVVPEINFGDIQPRHRIIANPNCSTIQMVLALSRLHWRYRIARIVVSTYQSITGTGLKAVRQLEAEERHFVAGAPAPTEAERAYPHQIFRNLFPHGGDPVSGSTILPDGYTTEEEKLVRETRKILGDDTIRVSATVARVPVVGGHSESVNVEFHEEYDLDEVRRLLTETPGVILADDLPHNVYPTPLMAHGRDEVFVGRLRRDPSQPRTLNLWCSADNLRKGAATNAVQILQLLAAARH